MKTWLEKKGKLVFTEPPLRELVEGLKDGLYSVEIIREKNQRTAKQNRLYHKWMSILEKESGVGYTADEWKEIMKSMFLREEYETTIGTMVRIKSTSELDTAEFGEFLKKVQDFSATEDGGFVDLRFPDDLGFEEWINRQ